MLKRLFTVFLVMIFPPVLAASDYQVEIIVFEHLYHDAENEIAEVGLRMPDPSNVIRLSEAGDEESSGFKPLSSGFHKLGGVYNELKYSREYRPLLHLSWQQPALGQSRSRYVEIRKQVNDTAGAVPDSLIRIDGLVRIRSSQFLHADVDLFYFVNPVTESFLQSRGRDSTAAPANGLRFAELQETRRMKLNELHYFDHPVFGLFMRVSRIKN